jgi:hypothetical protein
MALLRPRFTALDLYGPGVAVLSRMPYGGAQPWLTQDQGLRDALSGGFLPLAGPVPVVCGAPVGTRAILGFLEEAGLPAPGDVRAVRGPDEAAAALRALADSGLRIAAQHRQPEAELPAAWCAVPPALVGDLLDKSRLGDLFPPGRLLPRRILDSLPDRPEDLLREGPAILKVATGLPNGGGLGVRPVRDPAEARRACHDLAAGPRWVLEPWQAFTRSVCVHAAVLADGETTGLGAAEQVLAQGYLHEANWSDEASAVPGEVTGSVLEACARAAAQGYRGLAGVDVGFRADGSWAVLDANFRMNASSSLVLFREALDAAGFPCVRRSVRFTGPDLPRMLAAARPFVRGRAFLPLYAADPSAGAHGGEAMLRGIAFGTSRAETEARAREMAERLGPAEAQSLKKA